MLTNKDRAAITADHLLTFIAQIEMGGSRMDVARCIQILREASSDPQEKRLLDVAIQFIEDVEADNLIGP